nr:putative receptor-like protein kinase At3g47110 isoform X2 [Malus domestica]
MLSMIHCLCYIHMMIMANCLTAGVLAISHTNISTDQSALLSLKAHITSDPQNILTTNWSSASNSNICNWVGVSCGAGHHRVTALNLSHMGLAGVIPPHLGNLSFLVELGLENNSFHGPLPQELSRLRRLKVINLGNNGFMGTIPSWFGSFAKLQTIKLYGNGFSGFIPAAIFNLSALETINLGRNQLSGSIPREIGNLTMVKGIYLDDNKFEEFGMEGSVSTSGDVYSFGIVLMETFTKRKPTDEMFVGEMNLKQWIADSLFLNAAIDEVVDADIPGTEEDGGFVSMRVCLSSVMRLALACTAALPKERINMKDAAVALYKIKTKYLKDSGGVNS